MIYADKCQWESGFFVINIPDSKLTRSDASGIETK